eukprot:SAG11_NODE_5617_length_1506_cov_20.295665_1_plen_39_part_10
MLLTTSQVDCINHQWFGDDTGLGIITDQLGMGERGTRVK